MELLPTVVTFISFGPLSTIYNGAQVSYVCLYIIKSTCYPIDPNYLYYLLDIRHLLEMEQSTDFRASERVERERDEEREKEEQNEEERKQ